MKVELIVHNPRAKLVASRLPVIRNLVKGRKVLDIGCVNHEAESEKEVFWLHKFVKEHAENVLGMDYDEKEVRKLKRLGYNVVHGDAQDYNLKEKFEVVLAGELIEHLPNPGKFLECCKKHLSGSGIIILTTPNAFSFRNLLRALLFGVVPTNDEHTCWFTPITLRKLCETQGLRLAEFYSFFNPEGSKIKYFIERLICFLRPSYAPNMLFVLKTS